MRTDIFKCKLVKEGEVQYNAITQSHQAVEIARNLGLHEEAEEHVMMIALNARGGVLGVHMVSHGTVTGAVAEPRDVFKRAILNNASALILIHNHPSGDTTPSDLDVALTRRLTECGNLLGIKFLDHIIIGDGYISMFENGLMEKGA